MRTFPVKSVVKIRTYVLCNIIYFLNRAFCEIMWKNTVQRAGHRWQYNAGQKGWDFLTDTDTHTQNL